MKSVVCGVLLCLALGACSRAGLSSIVREDLFSLDIGRLEDQLALYGLEGDLGLSRVGLAMRDGLFYISDRNGGKLVRYNSYGDLLFMIYNDQSNSAPLSLKTNREENSIVTRWAFTYPLREPGQIAVDSRKHIYVEDRLPADRYYYDADARALLDCVVLHFDQEGRFVEYLGQEGVGGTPFSRITGIYTTVQDEIVVVCRQTTGWLVYWYASGTRSPLTLNLKSNAIPAPPDWPEVSASVDAIMAAPDSRELYLKVDYYRDIYDDSTNTRVGTEPDSSLIWVMDLGTGSYVDCLEVPFLEQTAFVNGRRETLRMLYSMMGIARGGRIFLSFPVDEGYSILILRRNGENGLTANVSGSEVSTALVPARAVVPSASLEQSRGLINVDREELYLNSFDLSEDGIISAILVSDYEAKIAWWRTDRILTEGTPSWP
ncbi:MAG: hypothetical protein LBF63_04090 [Treponema sp.]|nr:hypothetical protein [Treponema sp.]